ncbi:MAG TPA: acyl dehydratase [Gammaproteobacteria bacterium]|nr:acyl dehydratase [Gammaproteobacteria bacterium]
MTSIRQRGIAGIRPGDTFSVTRTFCDDDIIQFAKISGDYNPVHFDAPFAHAKGFKACISHGLLSASLTTEIGGQLGWLASQMNFRFKKPVYSGDTICCTVKVESIDERRRVQASATLNNQHGETVVLCELAAVAPTADERGRMQEITRGAPYKE